MIRVTLPYHLRTLARVEGEVTLPEGTPPTLGGVLDALEHRYPVLQGAIREHVTLRRRAFVRYFAGGQDLSHEPGGHAAPGGRGRRRGAVHGRGSHCRGIGAGGKR